LALGRVPDLRLDDFGVVFAIMNPALHAHAGGPSHEETVKGMEYCAQRSRRRHRVEISQPKYAHPLRRSPPSVSAPIFQFHAKARTIGGDDVSRSLIANHQTVPAGGQEHRRQQAQTGIQAVLIALAG
jgi:hypothetical protein